MRKYNFQKLHTDYTYLFEIIYKENRIVCDYDFEDVVLLGVINTKTGIEVNLHSDTEDVRIQNIIKNIGLNVVTRYNTFGEGFDVLKKEISKSKEGYVNLIELTKNDILKLELGKNKGMSAKKFWNKIDTWK